MLFYRTERGALLYRPWETFKLPQVVQVYEKTASAAHCSPEEGPTVDEWDERPVEVPLCTKSGHVSKTRRLYRLHWPGQIHEERTPTPDWDAIPPECLADLHLCRCGAGNDTDGDGDCLFCARSSVKAYPDIYSLQHCLRSGWNPPAELPLSVAYHLAVNGGLYYPHGAREAGVRPTVEQLEAVLQGARCPVRHPVGFLPAVRVEQILDTRFALDSHAMATLDHLKWQAESWFHNPHIMGFDTIIREGLYRACWTFVQLYFWLLSDYIYDHKSHYFSREDWKYNWWQLAGILFWTGRTGRGVVTELAGATPRFEARHKNFAASFPDVLESVEKWCKGEPYEADEGADFSG